MGSWILDSGVSSLFKAYRRSCIPYFLVYNIANSNNPNNLSTLPSVMQLVNCFLNNWWHFSRPISPPYTSFAKP
jgi:hypothetical protein